LDTRFAEEEERQEEKQAEAEKKKKAAAPVPASRSDPSPDVKSDGEDDDDPDRAGFSPASSSGSAEYFAAEARSFTSTSRTVLADTMKGFDGIFVLQRSDPMLEYYHLLGLGAPHRQGLLASSEEGKDKIQISVTTEGVEMLSTTAVSEEPTGVLTPHSWTDVHTFRGMLVQKQIYWEESDDRLSLTCCTRFEARLNASQMNEEFLLSADANTLLQRVTIFNKDKKPLLAFKRSYSRAKVK